METGIDPYESESWFDPSTGSGRAPLTMTVFRELAHTVNRFFARLPGIDYITLDFFICSGTMLTGLFGVPVVLCCTR